jgi:hypothetical protein
LTRNGIPPRRGQRAEAAPGTTNDYTSHLSHPEQTTTSEINNANARTSETPDIRRARFEQPSEAALEQAANLSLG